MTQPSESLPSQVIVRPPLEIGIGSVEYPRVPLRSLLNELARNGFSVTELVARGNVSRQDVREARRLLADAGVFANSVSAFTKLNEAVHEQVGDVQRLIVECIDLAADLDAPYVITYFGSNALLDDEAAIDRYVDLIQPCLRAAEANGVHLLLENLFDAVPPDIPASFRNHYRSSDVTRGAKACRTLLDRVSSPWLRYNFDPGNFYIGGEEPYPYAYLLLKPYIANVHLKDAAKYDPDLWGDLEPAELQRDLRGDYTCVPIGAGGVNYDGLLRQLVTDGYSGRLILEPHTGSRRLQKTIEDSLRFLSSHGFKERNDS